MRPCLLLAVRPARGTRRSILIAAALLLFTTPASAVSFSWVAVGSPGNAADAADNCFASDCGAVSYSYYISKYEVTNTQYAEFLNTVDPLAQNSLGLYSTSMSSNSRGGITQDVSQASGSRYAVKTDMGSKPVLFVSWYDTLRFANWLHNGQGGASTEAGAYTLLGGTQTPSNGATVTREAGATVFLPSENEWYKAAYYDTSSGVYYDYPAGTDTQTVCAAVTAGTNSANCNGAVNSPTDVGAYSGSASPNGSFDQGGNAWEWNEQDVLGDGSLRGLRGGSWATGASLLAASNHIVVDAPTAQTNDFGFRVASLVPEPGSALLVMLGLGGLGCVARRRAGRRER